MMLENYNVFFIGCVGAISPEILRLYRLRNSLRFTRSWGYILISIVLVLLGGFVAYILKPSNNCKSEKTCKPLLPGMWT